MLQHVISAELEAVDLLCVVSSLFSSSNAVCKEFGQIVSYRIIPLNFSYTFTRWAEFKERSH